MTGLEGVMLPRLSPDGAWVLYSETVRSPQANHSPAHRIMRVPVNAGLPQVVFEMPNDGFDFSCASVPGSFCTVLDESGEQGHGVLSAIDPLRGGSKMLRTTRLANFASGLSPDGSTFATAERGEAELWHSSEVGANAFLGGIPSPDGHYLAIWGGVYSSNVWMLEGF